MLTLRVFIYSFPILCVSFILGFFWFVPVASRATSYVQAPFSPGARSLCDQAAGQVSPFYGVPERMLQAMTLVETGVYNPKFGYDPNRTRVSWPWTLQVNGRGYYYATKQEAVDAANALLKRNIRNFDVGCMQLNMLHHGDAFSSMEEAFDPIKNVRYAAQYLLQLKRISGTWARALGAYHSKTPTLGQVYRERVRQAMITNGWLVPA